MTKETLILGSKGTLGQALVKEFSEKNYDVVAWDKEDVDVTSDSITEKIANVSPGIIINATADNAVDKIEKEEAERDFAYLINGKVPGVLSEIAKKMDAVFVHYSTNYVFSGEKKEGYVESDNPSPINEYGVSKLMGETSVNKVGGKNYIIRLSRLFGVKGISESSKRNFVDFMKAEIGKDKLEVGNTEFSSLAYAPDLAALTRQIVEKKYEPGIYHGVNDGECTWYEWAKEIFKILGKGPEVIPVVPVPNPQSTKKPIYATLLNTKLPKQRSWQEALREFLQEINK